MMAPLKNDRELLQKILLAAYETAKLLPKTDMSRIAIVGYCFGGLCALDLARSGVTLRGAVSLHGLLNAPNPVVKSQSESAVRPRVLVLHGYADPMVPPEQVLSFAREMTQGGFDWQMHMYGNCVHAFTNPHAQDANFGTVYNADADRRSWQAMSYFLQEVFAS